MRALLVTSAVTFMPDNYQHFISILAAHEYIAGLLVLNNRSWKLCLKALQLTMGAAPLLGRALLNNHWQAVNGKREAVFRQANKPVWYDDTVNCDRVHTLVKARHFDLLINARTRCIYSHKTLNLPRLGCINIHHGLLPQQRGTLCDFWALARQQAAGFSIHRMTKHLDDGSLLRVVQTSGQKESSYPDFLMRSSAIEAQVLMQLLDEIAEHGFKQGQPNYRKATHQPDRDPSWSQFRAIKQHIMEI